MSNQPTEGEQILLQLITKNTDILNRMTKIMEQQIIYTNLLLFPNGNQENDPRVTNKQEQFSKEYKETGKDSESRIEAINSKSVSKKD